MAIEILVFTPLASSDDGYVINRGGTIAKILFILVFIDIVQSGDYLLGQSKFSSPGITNSIGWFNFVEDLINGGSLGFRIWYLPIGGL